jgi:hypothetical protein
MVYYQKKLSDKQYRKQQSYTVNTKSTCFKKEIHCVYNHTVKKVAAYFVLYMYSR